MDDALEASMDTLFGLLSLHRPTKPEASGRTLSMVLEVALGDTLEEIGERHGVTRQRVHQIVGWRSVHAGVQMRKSLAAKDAPRKIARRNARRAKTKMRVQEMLAMRYGGLSNIEIAEETGATVPVVAMALLKSRVEALELPHVVAPHFWKGSSPS